MTHSKAKNKMLDFELLTRSQKRKKLLRVPNSIAELLLFHFWVAKKLSCEVKKHLISRQVTNSMVFSLSSY